MLYKNTKLLKLDLICYIFLILNSIFNKNNSYQTLFISQSNFRLIKTSMSPEKSDE